MAIDISMNVPLVNIIGQWFKNYHGKKYDMESEAAVSRNNASIRAENINTDNIPNEAKKAIDIADYIAGSDLKAKSNKPQSPIELKNNLYYVGQMESEYKTKTQIGGGPAKSYWQVEPKTAIDIMNNAPNYFGSKFEETFAPKYGVNAKDKLKSMSMDELSSALEQDDSLAATFAAMKINQTYD